MRKLKDSIFTFGNLLSEFQTVRSLKSNEAYESSSRNMQNIVLLNSNRSLFRKTESRHEDDAKTDFNEEFCNILIRCKSRWVLVAGFCECGDETSCCV